MEAKDTNSKIFQSISDIVIQQDFTDAQHMFFEKNKDTFEDTEENKLEHTTIFQDYLCILEQIIEAKLKETFIEEEIESFFGSFEANMKLYQEMNEGTVDILFSFIKFEVFKEKMITFKRGI